MSSAKPAIIRENIVLQLVASISNKCLHLSKKIDTSINSTSGNREPILQSNTQAFFAFLVIAPFSMSSVLVIIAQWEKTNPVNYNGLLRG
jgi:hypothetical protein